MFEERDRITADLHDEIGGGLSTIRILSDIHKDVNELDTHKKFALKIAEISSDLSDKMRTIIWTLKPENDQLHNFVSYINEYSKSIFDNTSVLYSFHEYNINTHHLLHSMIRKNIFLCLKETLTNILKHAQATEATIIISIIEGKTLSILIQDNGIGFSQKNSLGNGIRIMEKRMKEINGTFYIESTTKGTIITLKAIL